MRALPKRTLRQIREAPTRAEAQALARLTPQMRSLISTFNDAAAAKIVRALATGTQEVRELGAAVEDLFARGQRAPNRDTRSTWTWLKEALADQPIDQLLRHVPHLEKTRFAIGPKAKSAVHRRRAQLVQERIRRQPGLSVRAASRLVAKELKVSAEAVRKSFELERRGCRL